MTRPNGLIGTPDGKKLYVADWGAGTVYSYDIQSDGTLANQTEFASVTCDGMTIDRQGNVYLTENSVLVYDPSGVQIGEIAVPERPTNVAFGGSDRKTLFVTAGTSLYSIPMNVEGIPAYTPQPIHHHGDFNGDPNGRIELVELLRFIQFFNIGGYHCPGTGETSEDGYLPGSGDHSSCAAHDGDFDGGPNWIVGLKEILRMVQFFNMGGYHACDDPVSEDGFCPGPAPAL